MGENYSHAASRLRHDAKKLASGGRFQNAGYLIGLAAECLVKEILENAAVTIDRQSDLRHHFPTLVKKITSKGHGRFMGALMSILQSNFLNNWQIELRYEENSDAANAQEQWRNWETDVDGLFRAAGKI